MNQPDLHSNLSDLEICHKVSLHVVLLYASCVYWDCRSSLQSHNWVTAFLKLHSNFYTEQLTASMLGFSFVGKLGWSFFTKGNDSFFALCSKDWSETNVTLKWPLYDRFWPLFLAYVCILIFHKFEVQTVILICSAGLNFNWFKSYGLKCSLRPRATLANSQKIATNKWPFNDHFWLFFCQLYVHLSQNWSSDGHLEVLIDSKS